MNYRKYEILKLSRYIYIYKKKVKSKRENKKNTTDDKMKETNEKETRKDR